jgi:SAM-dependent methyltransferase
MGSVDADAWDRRYAETDLVWSATPNAVVAREAADLPPGRALDLASGEGRNAIWLAERGWRVTAVDFSAVATERTRRLAAERLGPAADRVDAVTADLLAWSPEPNSADLAVLAYLQLGAAERSHAHRLAAAALAPGGTFLLVAHHSDNLAQGVGGPQDSTVLFTQSDVVADLEGTGLVVARAQRVERVVAAEGGNTHRAHGGDAAVALDVLVRAYRPA